MFTKWDHRFMEMAQLVSTWASCYQEERKIGAVIVKDKRVMTTGYNGAPSGVKTCVERGECLRKKLGIPSGTRHEMCYAVHAEQNAIIQAAKLGVNIIAVKRDGKVEVTLDPDRELSDGDVLVVLGDNKALERVQRQ